MGRYGSFTHSVVCCGYVGWVCEQCVSWQNGPRVCPLSVTKEVWVRCTALYVRHNVE